MKRTLSVIFAVIVLIIGIAFLSYPLVSNIIIQVAQSHVAKVHIEAEHHVDDSQLAEMRQEAYEYNENLLAGKVVVIDPFDPNRVTVGEHDYDEVLNLAGDGVMAVIRIPKIHITFPIYHGVDDEELEHGVGHLPSTSLPIGGESSHCVLAGHTGLPSVKIFDDIDQLAVGDYFSIEVLGEEHGYRVESVEVVLPEETDSLVIYPGKDMVTLVTCTPYGINTHRLLVHASRCELPEGWDGSGVDVVDAITDTGIPPQILLIAAIVVLVVILLLIPLLIRRRRKKREAKARIKAEAGKR